MKFSNTVMAAGLSTLAQAAPAPVPQSGSVAAWGQCGGQGWTGGTTCVSGYTCTVSNQYYSQCLPGAASSKTTTTTKVATTTSKAATTTTKAATTTTSKAATTTAKTTSAAAPTSSGSGKLEYIGVNESGAEFGTDKYPGIYNTDYTWYTLSTYDTFIAQGFNMFRLNFAMERMIPNQLTGSLDPAYVGNLTQQVNYITSKGAYALIQPHNYGRYYDNIITDTSAFEAFWKTLAAVYKDNSKVVFDTNNEYNTMAGALVRDLNQAAINGIRAAGATTQTIHVEGNAWTGAWTWTTTAGTDGLTNAQTMGNLTDPSNKLVYQMHQYLDSDGSGTSATCVSSTIGSERLVAATNWLRTNGKVGIIGEFAGGVNAVCEAAVTDMLNYMVANSDVWQGALWWAAGPWWGTYIYGLEPTAGVAYSTYTPILSSYA